MVYEALADIFVITVSWQLITLGTLLGVLSASLIVSIIVGRKYYNMFTRLYSVVSAVWFGFFGYLFLVSVLYGLMMMLPIVVSTIIGEIFIICTVLVSIYAIVHAKNIHTKEVQIVLPNLPANWVGKRAVWVSDLHLGQILGSSFAERVVEKINSIPYDIVFIGGDLYDGTSAPDVHALIAPLKKLKGLLAPQGVYFITGNHEEFGNNEVFLSAVKSLGIEVLQDRMVEIDGLQLVGVDYHTASKKEQFKKILSGLSIDKKKVSILLKHEPKDLNVAEEAGITFQISGHTHRAQMWPLQYMADLAYKGFAYGLKSFQEMHVYTSSGVGTWGPPMRIGTNSEIVVFTFCAKI